MKYKRHITKLLISGLFLSLSFSTECDEGTILMDNYLGNEEICVPESFATTIQSNLQAFYIINTVHTGNDLAASEDWVGAFNGDICVGAQQWDVSQCVGGVCAVSAMGLDSSLSITSGYMSAGDILTFKIFDASTNQYLNATASEEFAWNDGEYNIIETLTTGFIDECGVADGDNSSCADDCGVPNGNNDTCWYIDIEAVWLFFGVFSIFLSVYFYMYTSK